VRLSLPLRCQCYRAHDKLARAIEPISPIKGSLMYKTISVILLATMGAWIGGSEAVTKLSYPKIVAQGPKATTLIPNRLHLEMCFKTKPTETTFSESTWHPPEFHSTQLCPVQMRMRFFGPAIPPGLRWTQITGRFQQRMSRISQTAITRSGMAPYATTREASNGRVFFLEF
jgi:hypothetical protein